MQLLNIGIQIISAALLGLVYNISIDKYVDRLVSQWTEEKVPLMIHQRNNISFKLKSVSELRRTVVKRSGIVERTEDRKSWNAWLTDTCNKGDKTKMELNPGVYYFAYRSYSNWEEAGAIKASLFHLKTMFGLSSYKTPIMTIYPDGKRISISDFFRIRGLFSKKADVSWNGIIKNVGGKLSVEWTDTHLIMDKKMTVRPPQSEVLRKIPWDLVKMEDGMLAFQRGDVGMLAYDLNPLWCKA